jgi:hypothetical protein
VGTLWAFCARSLLRDYGWRFVWRVAAPHPVRTARALRDASAIDPCGRMIAVPPVGEGAALNGGRRLVGLGFCLKPMLPECPSGRPNHDCLYLERLHGSAAASIPAPCRTCAIREVGAAALRAGAALYIMTSARDILHDVFEPSLERREFDSGLFLLCGYSVRPFAAGLLASGIRGALVPFERGACEDYRTWLLADRGIKHEQTGIGGPSYGRVLAMLEKAARVGQVQVERRGNVLHPKKVEAPSHQPGPGRGPDQAAGPTHDE